MNVTIDNFEKVLDEFDKVIETAAFFSIDSEFTGLFSERTLPFSTPSEFYKKLHGGTDDYIIVQLGITAFCLSEEDHDTFTYKSYNFYVYPQNRDQVFKCSGSCISFLAEQKFDFNKLFSRGVSCCTQDVAVKLREKYDERQKSREEALEVKDEKPSNFDEVPVPPEEVDKLNEVKERIQKFLENKEDSETEQNVVFGNCNAFQRKLIYQVIQRDFHDEITATSQTVNNQKAIVIERKWSTERQQQEVEQQNQDDENEYRRLVGLSALLLKISQSKKPIVGHNMFMDLFYLIRQFFEPLPGSLKSFKRQSHKIFPNIFDTKHICNQICNNKEIPNSMLRNLYESVLQAPFKLPNIEPASSEYGYSDVKEHEAGYDSFMTGVCFLGLVSKLNINNSEISSKCPRLRPLLNKVFVMRLTDIYYIDLTGTEPKPNREHVFHVIFPETWTQTDIIDHFRKYGPVQIRWIDSSSAFVALINRENSTILLKTIESTKGVKVSTFSTYLRVTGADLDDDCDDDNDDAEHSEMQKRSCIDPSNQRWNIYLVVLAVILIIFFFIIPDFMIIWELQLRKQVQSLFI